MSNPRKFLPASVNNPNTQLSGDQSFTADQIKSYAQVDDTNTSVVLKNGRTCTVSVPIEEIKAAYLEARNADGGIKK